MIAPMAPAAADWIYTEVLTQKYKESTGAIMWTGKGDKRRDGGQGAAFLRVCACQYRPCGHCSGGRHDRCRHHDWQPAASPNTRIVSRRGYALAAVWHPGKPCAWRCSCSCPAPVAVDPEQSIVTTPEQAFVQLDLFSLAGGAR